MGAILLGAKGIFAKYLYAAGVDFETVVTVRSALAVPGFLLIAFAGGGLAGFRQATASDWWQAALAGLICYCIGASANFYALTLIDASVERALLFSYPALVVIWNWVRSGQRPTAGLVVAVVATYLGIALTVGAFDSQLLARNWRGALWVLFCAATIAYYFIASGKLTRHIGSGVFTVIAMTAAALGLASAYQVTHGWQTLSLSPDAWWLMLALVAISTVIPLYLVAEGVRRIGAERAAIGSTVGPPAAALLAVLLLGETLRFAQLAGIGMIVGGILLLELGSKASAASAKTAS